MTWLRLALSIAVAALASTAAGAHQFGITRALLVLESDGSYLLDLTVDVDALALGASPSTDDAELVAELDRMSAAEFELALERARDTLVRRVRLRFDGVKQRPVVSFPGMELPEIDPGAPPTVLGTVARLSGRIPGGAREVTFGASRTFGPVRLTILDEGPASGMRTMLGVAEDSLPYVLGAENTSETQPTRPAAGTVATYLRLGFEHILPLGLDHILFVLGLFLLSTRPGPLLWQVTAFTVAHTASLALSMTGMVGLPSHVVEPLIALSIAYVAIENVVTQELKPWRPLLVFGFGLVHGLGFAGALRQVGIPQGELVPALLAFNVGVELGQLAVVLFAWLVLGQLRRQPWYRSRVVVPLSLAIAAVGLYWAVERSF